MAPSREGHTNGAVTSWVGEAETPPPSSLPPRLDERRLDKTELTCPVLRQIKVVVGKGSERCWTRGKIAEWKGRVQ